MKTTAMTWSCSAATSGCRFQLSTKDWDELPLVSSYPLMGLVAGSERFGSQPAWGLYGGVCGRRPSEGTVATAVAGPLSGDPSEPSAKPTETGVWRLTPRERGRYNSWKCQVE